MKTDTLKMSMAETGKGLVVLKNVKIIAVIKTFLREKRDAEHLQRSGKVCY